MNSTISQRIDQHLDHLIGLRHRLHQTPEIGYEEFATAELIRQELADQQIPFIAGVPDAPTATVATLGDPAKPCIALRADIDALPIIEQTGLPYASTNPGMMHACGHDGHATILLGVAAMLKKMEQELPVCVKLIWQPAEEGGGGAYRLVDAGVLDGRLGPKVGAIFGLHGWPGLPAGIIATRPGALLAATDNFSITFIGSGCHGAYPHLGRDPIVTAAEAVVNLQQLVSREIDPTESAVLTIGKINGGTAVNIIPDTATIEGTARTLNEETRQQVRQAMERRVSAIARANDCRVQLAWTEGYPCTINDPAAADFVADTARQVLGNDRYLPVAKPSMGGEDFSYYLQQIPGCFFLLGVRPDHLSIYPPLHSDRYDFTDSAMPVGVRMFVELAIAAGNLRHVQS
ncbi:MAG: amidohydrolase [Phycisphaerales bacterium]|nr:amidohydrolase [Phycisphaerales bacterium]